LGVARFQDETGIKESDWRGRYWATWGDAVREAGFSANTLQGSYSEGHLIDRMIELVRELGRVPRSVDLQLKRRGDLSFPTHNVYQRRWPKAKLIERLRAHCGEHTGYEDVVTILDQDKTPAGEVPDDGSADAIAPVGFVYLAKSGRHYKIGKTNAVGRRERELAIQLPERMRTVHVIRTDDPVGIEAYWHTRFAPKRANGEWFSLDSSDVAAFRRRKFM